MTLFRHQPSEKVKPQLVIRSEMWVQQKSPRLSKGLGNENIWLEAWTRFLGEWMSLAGKLGAPCTTKSLGACLSDVFLWPDLVLALEAGLWWFSSNLLTPTSCFYDPSYGIQFSSLCFWPLTASCFLGFGLQTRNWLQVLLTLSNYLLCLKCFF